MSPARRIAILSVGAASFLALSAVLPAAEPARPAQQPDAASTITRTLFVGLAMIESIAIYCFVVSMILIFANPFWNHVIAGAAQAANK